MDEDELVLNVKKPRARKSRTLRFGRDLADRPWSAVGILQRLIAATGHLRSTSDGFLKNELWLTTARGNDGGGYYRRSRCRFSAKQGSLAGWIPTVECLGTAVDVSAPLDVRRIRKGKVAERAIALNGSISDIARDDHTIEVFNKYYAHAESIQVYSAQRVIQYQSLLSDLAQSGMVIFTDPHEALSIPELATAAGIDESVATAVKAGDLDVGVAACRDPFDSPFGKSGLLCAAAPLYCLACTNALVFPSHAPYIRDFVKRIDGQRSQLAPDEWIVAYGQQYASAERVLEELGIAPASDPLESPPSPRSDLPMWVTGFNDV